MKKLTRNEIQTLLDLVSEKKRYKTYNKKLIKLENKLIEMKFGL